MAKHYFLISLFIIPIISTAQSVDEIIQLDTITETIQVVYKTKSSGLHYTIKTAVFANDTAQIAIEKSINKNGKSGVYKVFYPNGSIKIRTVYANNKLNGEWTYYDKKGVIKIKGNYASGVKHGYWAYKSLKIYGRYRHGLKSWRWYRINENKKKVKSTYKKGVLVRGEGVGGQDVPVSTMVPDSLVIETPKENKGILSAEYKQAITFLKENLVFKKALKVHFSKNGLTDLRKLKKHFFRGEFQFVTAPLVMNLGINSFIEDSKNGKIVVAKIDSILKNNNQLRASFDENKVEENLVLYNSSTKKNSPMAVYFSRIQQNLLRIDVVRFDDEVLKNNFEDKYNNSEKVDRFQILLYFDDAAVLKGAEYEKP